MLKKYSYKRAETLESALTLRFEGGVSLAKRAFVSLDHSEKYPREVTTYVVNFIHEKSRKFKTFHSCLSINSKSTGNSRKLTITDYNFLTHIMKFFP